MKNALKIFMFTVLVTAFYNYVGQTVPQKETYPPKEIEITDDMTTEDLVIVGSELMAGKGTCLTCHTMGGSSEGARYPDLAGIGSIAETRVEGQSGLDYLAESLYDPNAYIVEGFLPGMPIIHKPPISLTDQEILAVIAYLQSLGGEPTVTLATELQWQGQSGGAAEAAALAGMSPLERAGTELFTNWACYTCHNLDKPDKLLGPSLMDVGARLTLEQLKLSITDPDAELTEGYPKGLMKGTLDGLGFYSKITPDQLNTLVEFLASKRGEQ